MRNIYKAGITIAYSKVIPGVIGISSPIFEVGIAPIASFYLTLADVQTVREMLEQISDDGRTTAANLATNWLIIEP